MILVVLHRRLPHPLPPPQRGGGLGGAARPNLLVGGVRYAPFSRVLSWYLIKHRGKRQSAAYRVIGVREAV